MTPEAFAEVAVNIPVRPRSAGVENEAPRIMTFCYHVPPELSVRPGHLVWVSFGSQQVQGIVLSLSACAPAIDTKPVLAICDPQPYLSPTHQQLARWMADYYLCSISDAAFSFLPPGIEQRSIVVVEPAASALRNPLPALNDAQAAVWNLVSSKGRLSLDDIRRETRLGRAQAVVDQLLRRGLVTKHQEVQPPKARPKLVRTTWLLADTDKVQAEIAALLEPRLRRARLLRTLLQAGSRLPMAELRRRANCERQTVADLAKMGLLRIERGRDGPVSLAATAAAIETAISGFEEVPAGGRAALLAFLAQHPEPIDVSELTKAAGATAQQVNALAEKGLVHVEQREVRRDPLAQHSYAATLHPAFTPSQEQVYKAISEEIELAGRQDGAPRPVLLHGVTGSGKTEIYLRILKDTLALGKQAIIMVPEISLTPQTIQRFASRFPGNVAVLHSRLTMGEHFDEWRRIRDGLVDIVIGSRSAVFAPVPRLGLIIMDEEHEWTYKQSDVAPRYHAREVALKLAELTCALVIMGSATPDIVSYQRARDGEFKLVDMPERVVRAVRVEQGAESSQQRAASSKQQAASSAGVSPAVASPAAVGQASLPDVATLATAALPSPISVIESPLPPVELVDLRVELKAGNRSIFSRSLHDAMTVALAAKEQVILFLNRRGTATFIMCRDCGHVLRCKSCDSPLALHMAEDDLVCHQCNRRYLIPPICPQCWSKRIKYFGIGTQKVEQETQLLFPAARILRWDRDVTGSRFAHELILDRFVRHEADVLIGTQMIAKGLDLPLVTLVGVISADTALHLPDFRAGERTFQILTQVAGRAGRSTLGGKVIIQTYTPEHYAIQAASRHDYATFAAQELAFRAEKGYPPFGRLARLVLQHPNKEKAQAEAERMHQALKLRVGQFGLPEIKLIGPVPCFVSRLRGRYRWQIIVQAPDVHPLLAGMSLPASWIMDIDPVSLL